MRKEILAGLSTFFTAAYLLLLYPKILCEGGIDFGSALTATIAVIVLSTLFLALFAQFPVLLAPGLSVGPFLVYSVILKEHASWETALGIVFWSGVIVFFLSIFKVRQKILSNLPSSIKSAAISGIGIFLITIGLKNLGIFQGNILTVPNAISLFGLLLFFTLNHFQMNGSFLITILTCWIISIPFGLIEWEGVVALPQSLNPTLFHLDFLTPLQARWLGTILSVTLICLFDTSAALTVLAKLANKIDERGRIKKIDRIVIVDGIGNIVAALFGTGTLTFTLESSSGIKAGGRTGVTAIVASLCCLSALFFYPILSSIPLFAIVPILIAIGIFMAVELKEIKWNKWDESIPAIITLVLIPLTFNIYKGFAFGFVSFALAKAINGKYKEVHPICWTLALIFAAHLSWSLINQNF